MARPFVSVITPTYNRRRYFQGSLECFLQQTYPRDRMEWLILDDGTETLEDLVLAAKSAHPTLNIRYIRVPEKLPLGAKRNRLNREARGEIIVCWDDDDYYPPDRVAHVVHKFRTDPRIEVAGSSLMYIYFQDDKSIWENGPYGPFHTTNGPMAYKKSYVSKHFYDEDARSAEEKDFLNSYNTPVIQLDARKAILVIAHKENTVSKDFLRTDQTISRKTSLKLKDFIREASMRAFYE